MNEEERYTDAMPEGDDEDQTIVLTDEDGNELEFELCDTVEYDGAVYAVLLPTDEESEEAVIMLMEDDPESDDTLFTLVEDEDVAETVFNLFRENASDGRFDFE